MKPKDVLELIVEPTLAKLPGNSPEATLLVLGTGLAESGYQDIRQWGGGPALGPWQMEPATHDDIWRNFIAYRDALSSALESAADVSLIGAGQAGKMAWNLRYACAMCRIHYLRQPGAVPKTLDEQAAYWKQHYNTPLGKGTVAHYLKAWRAANLGEF